MHWHANPNPDIWEAGRRNAALRFVAGNRAAALQTIEKAQERTRPPLWPRT
jgi:hypothetical protein